MDEAGDRLVEPAVALVREWMAAAERSLTRREAIEARRFRALTGDPASVAFAMAFCDRVLRPESDEVAAAQLRQVTAGTAPAFLSRLDRGLLRAGSWLSRAAPSAVLPLARRRLRQLVGSLVADRSDPALAEHLRRLRGDGFAVNANLLGELVLGNDEAARRRDATIALLARPDIDYVSVKASSVTSQLNLWAYDHTLERVKDSLRPIFAAAAERRPAKFVNLDMEEYKDLRLTADAFIQLLDEPALSGIEAGIVLQAYLPDSFAAMQELTGWAERRRQAGGAGIKIRVVKGANLAMERVDAALHGWELAPYGTKAETDANYKRMLDWALDPARAASVRIGVASHNLFDVAWARLLADARGVADRVELEMLQGMAPGLARVVRDAAGGLLLYTPVVAAADFDNALAYLFRRLEENSAGENFLHHLFDLAHDEGAFASERARFEQAVAARWAVSDQPRRHRPRQPAPAAGFANEPDTDPTDRAARNVILATLARPPDGTPPTPLADIAAVDTVVVAAVAGHRHWAAVSPRERQYLLRRVADELVNRRPELLAIMAAEAGKTLAEGDGEVSETIDFARYYAEQIPRLDQSDGARFEPLGVVAVVPPWNFPLAIPGGGVFAALAAGNAVILKPAPQTPRSAYALAEASWSAGIPPAVLQYIRCPDAVVGERLVGHPDLGGIILTGAYETAELFRRLAPATPLFAETSGKNAIIVLPDADLDLAVTDLVRSAFGHAGQKCSAASLAILVGPVAKSERFRRQLVDATTTLVVAPSTRPEAVMGPLIEAPSEKLHRALTTLEPGQRWWLEPRRLDAEAHLWSPGIVAGVRPGSWFHRTECFGPVLGVMAADDLDAAIAIQNGVAFGLTGGIHTLDPANVDHWLGRVEVGNAYINRAITGAVVRRQPFGGWKRSVVGPGAKAGGPNYVAQLGRWIPTAPPATGQDPSRPVQAMVALAASGLPAPDRAWLDAAARSDAHWWAVEFGSEHDPTALFCEANVFRYRPLPSIVVRVGAEADVAAVVRVLAAATLVGSPLHVSVDPGFAGAVALEAIEHWREDGPAFADWVRSTEPPRVRQLGIEAAVDLPVATYRDDRPVVGDGRIELARYLREQAISRTLHRFGNLVTQASTT